MAETNRGLSITENDLAQKSGRKPPLMGQPVILRAIRVSGVK